LATIHGCPDCIRPGILSGGAKIVEARIGPQPQDECASFLVRKGEGKNPEGVAAASPAAASSRRLHPLDLAALRLVHGVGDRKIAAYGPAFVNAVRQFLGQ
jgi:hypothetical protein